MTLSPYASFLHSQLYFFLLSTLSDIYFFILLIIPSPSPAPQIESKGFEARGLDHFVHCLFSSVQGMHGARTPRVFVAHVSMQVGRRICRLVLNLEFIQDSRAQ